ncbi:putative 50S ribosomal protein L3 [Cardiosporidium cionae]|uniref:Large ribosomal subunit protein uL3c n=1 Tax=Cardiosporidium cionae TaxID=476202 RepID=A0ABQ7JAN7_9APIC|nr:putative 50S ribosomal protein L3 [Cardiosporidium cionae]|eukprot:KAF8821013.1 putative 50S ribosomal protein L3 [Cardiosporidium cionae]
MAQFKSHFVLFIIFEVLLNFNQCIAHTQKCGYIVSPFRNLFRFAPVTRIDECECKRTDFPRSILRMISKAITIRAPYDPRPFLWNTAWPEALPKIQLMGRKLKMAEVFSPDGIAVAATVVEVLPGYICCFSEFGFARIAYGKFLSDRRWNTRPFLGQLHKVWANNAETAACLIQPPQNFVLGQILDVACFRNVSHLSITGVGKGKGFGGCVSRHGFRRGPMSHGSGHHRGPGSIGAGTTPGRVLPGKKMAGRYGNKQATIHGIKVLAIDPLRNLIMLKGSIPGSRNAIVSLTRDEFNVDHVYRKP